MTGSVLYDAPGPRARRRHLIISVISTLLIAGLLYVLIAFLAAPRTTDNGAELPGMFDASRWDIFLDLATWRAIWRGTLATLQMSSVAAVIAISLGVLLSFLRTARAAWIRTPTTVVLELLRGMPVLLMMLFVLLVFSAGPYWSGVAALALYNGAIISEILRAGIVSLPKGQREAGLAIGLTPTSTRFRIEFPQAFRQMLPIIVAQLVVLQKDTALAYVIGYSELLRVGTNQLSNYFGNRYFFSLFFVVLAIYLVINFALTLLARRLARSGSGTPRPRIPGRGVFGGARLMAGGTRASVLPVSQGGRTPRSGSSTDH